MSDMFDPDVHPLFQITVPYNLVNDNPHSPGGNIIDNPSSPMVVLVRHTPLHGSISLDIYYITDPVGLEVGAELDGTGLLEPPLEHVPRTGAVTE